MVISNLLNRCTDSPYITPAPPSIDGSGTSRIGGAGACNRRVEPTVTKRCLTRQAAIRTMQSKRTDALTERSQIVHQEGGREYGRGIIRVSSRAVGRHAPGPSRICPRAAPGGCSEVV